MELKNLNAQQTAQIYSSLLVHDFPADERKPLKMILDAMAQGKYRCIGIFEGEALRGYAFFVTLEQNGQPEILLDYYAIVQAYRGGGIGSAFLRQIPSLFPEAGAVLIEAETPEAADTEAEKMIRERRIRFYERCGCKNSGIRAAVFGVDFNLIQMPVGGLYSAHEICQIYASIYQKLLPESVYHSKIAIYHIGKRML